MALYPVRRAAGSLFERQLNANFTSLDARIAALETGTQIAQAERVVLSTYGDTVSVATKAKNLNKFGRSANVDTGQECVISEFQGATQYEETFVYDNLIDRVSSSNAGDTQAITIEGHTINTSTGDLTFVVQNVTLNGQTPVSLPTPLARCSRLYIRNSGTLGTPQAVFAGNIHVFDNSATSVTAGVPGTPAATKMYVTAGRTQSQKCQTTTSSVDYWFLTEAEFSITGGSPTAKVEFQIEFRDAANGGQWRPLGPEISLETGAQTAKQIEFSPYLIVPKNHDVRALALSTANNTAVTAEIQGLLAIVTG